MKSATVKDTLLCDAKGQTRGNAALAAGSVGGTAGVVLTSGKFMLLPDLATTFLTSPLGL